MRSRIQLARAVARTGDVAGAITHYEAFLVDWSGADQDIPILVEATHERARLGSQ